MNKIGFFQDDNGNLSSNRLIFVIGMVVLVCVTAFAVVYTAVKFNSNLVQVLLAAGAFFSPIATILYAGKVIQKGQENKVIPPSN